MAPLNGTPLSANRAELVDEMAGLEFHLFAGVPRELLPELKSMPVRFGQAEPYCVRWETGQALGPKFAELASDFTAGLIIRMAGAGLAEARRRSDWKTPTATPCC